METKNETTKGFAALNRFITIFFRYAAAFWLSGAALYLKTAFFHPLGAQTPFLLFYAAIMLSALLAGTGPGLLAIILSAAAVQFYFLPADISSTERILTIIVFIAEAAAILALLHNAKRLRQFVHKKNLYFKSLIDQSNYALTVLDAKGSILFGSAAIHKVIDKNPKHEQDNIINAIHPLDKKTFLRGLDKVVANPETAASAEIRLQQGDQSWHWVEAIIKNLSDDPNIRGIIANYNDLTDKRKNNQEINKSKQQLEIILNGVADGIIAQAASGAYIYANNVALKIMMVPTFQELLNTPPEAIVKNFEILDEYGQPLDPSNLPNRQVLLGKEVRPLTVRFRYKNKNSERWAVIKSTAIFDEEKHVIMAVTIIKDVTKIKMREERLMRSENYYRFLAQAGEILSSSLNYKITLASMARHAVPKIADYCSVSIIDKNGALKNIIVAHKDPQSVAYANKLNSDYPQDQSSNTGIASVVRTGKTAFYQELTPEILKAGAKSEEHYELMMRIGFRSAIIAPLSYQDKIYGAVTFVNSTKKYNAEDVVLAEEIGRRAGMAIENSRLYISAENIIKREYEHLALLDTLLSNAPIGFAFFNKNLECLRMNSSLTAMLELKDASVIINRKISDISLLAAQEIEPLLYQVLKTGQPVINNEFNSETLGIAGPKRYWLKSFYPVAGKNDEIMGVGVLINEISERKIAEDAIKFQALHDPLTGLPNRKYFQEKLEYLISHQPESKKSSYAVIFLDLDRFKNINDSLGHDVGDLVLKKISQRLRKGLADKDLIARWGGDEFIILVSDVTSSRNIQNIAKKILKKVREEVHIENYVLHVGASMGIVQLPYDGNSVHDLLKNADIAMYRAKEAGRNQYQLFNQTMNTRADQRLMLENDLRTAVKQREFELKYQPVMNLLDGKIISVEALVRWNHPKFGPLSPKDFISVAEETGTIIPLGKWIMRQACKQGFVWSKELPLSPKVTVNLSARQFSQANLVATITDILSETRLNPEHLELEITESIAMENIERTSTKLNDLKSMGVNIIIDDFGTGYSSLSYLKRFPLNKLKIDQSFVKNCITDEQDAAIIKAIISMAHSLKLKVVAEGVETQEQLAFLAANACDYIQGYLLGKPMEAQIIPDWLKSHYSTNNSSMQMIAEAYKNSTSTESAAGLEPK